MFNYKLKIKEHHLDTFGHMNNATYLALYEEARWEMITAMGYGLKEIKKKQIGPVILEANVKFKREIHNRETINITTKFGEMKNRLVMTIEQQMLKENGDVASSANFLVGVMDLEKRKLITPTKEWMHAMEQD